MTTVNTAQPIKIKKEKIWTGYQVALAIFILAASLLCLLPFVNVIAVSFSSKSAILRGDVGFWPVAIGMQMENLLKTPLCMWRIRSGKWIHCVTTGSPDA